MANQNVDPQVRKIWDKLEEEEQAMVTERRRLKDVWKQISAMHKSNEEARKAFEKEGNFNFIPPSERVVLNVGGHLYETTAGVLCRDRYSLLAALCKSNPPIAKDNTGAFFLDRDWYVAASFYRLNSLRRAIERRRPVLTNGGTRLSSATQQSDYISNCGPLRGVEGPQAAWTFGRAPSPLRTGGVQTQPDSSDPSELPF